MRTCLKEGLLILYLLLAEYIFIVGSVGLTLLFETVLTLHLAVLQKDGERNEVLQTRELLRLGDNIKMP